MITDIILILIVLLFGFIGMKIGFTRSLLELIRSFASLLLSIFLTPFIKTFLMKNTSIYNNLFPISENTQNLDNINTFIPNIIKDSFISPITELIFSAIIFVVLFNFIKLIFRLITILISPRKRNNFVGGTDMFLGFLFGIVKGIIIASILVAVILPICDVINPSLSLFIKNSIQTSSLTKYLYENNPIWMISKLLLK